MIPTQLEELHRTFWNNFNSQFNLSTNEGCGKYTEGWVKYAQNHGFSKVGHLKKNPSQTQYNGHAVDAFLYADGTDNDEGLFQAVDLIGGAEGPNPTINWGVDIPRYTIKDWLKEPSSGGNQPIPQTVPWVAYDENSFQRLKNMLSYDYARRPQMADFDVSVWSARVFHSAYMGPERIPLGLDAAINKHRPEWCAALGVPVDNYNG